MAREIDRPVQWTGNVHLDAMNAMECPLCHQGPGDPCVTTTGKPAYTRAHRARFDALMQTNYARVRPVESCLMPDLKMRLEWAVTLTKDDFLLVMQALRQAIPAGREADARDLGDKLTLQRAETFKRMADDADKVVQSVAEARARDGLPPLDKE